MKKLFLMTDLEGVAGVMNGEDWLYPRSRYYELAREFLTAEVNAAIEGFLAGGIEEILVCDGHGAGAIASNRLHPKALLLRGFTGWPLELDKSFDAIAWVGQHAKACTPQAHLAHTQWWSYVDFTINGRSVGEPGQLGYCASELGVRAIFGSGDLAFTKEFQDLYPGAETVWVKRGVNKASGEELDTAAYENCQLGAIHFSPQAAREMIRAGAERAVRRARTENFGLIPIKTPVEISVTLRQDDKHPHRRISRWSHASSVIGALNMPWDTNQKVLDPKKT
ncbi:MAG TPA: M55 family metallopeptidase [Planctomycetota bacterium]|nr:M55 family metallopeptidase [Planctomycetota bacterium]